MSKKSNEENRKEFLEMQAAFRNMITALKAVNKQIEVERKAFDVVENENVRLVICKN